MVIKYSEKVKKPFEGTVIDIETIGSFNDKHDDSRRYQNHVPVILGYMNKEKLEIRCAESLKDVELLQDGITQTIPTLSRPLYGFNCIFERGVFFHSCGEELGFDGELNMDRYEPKRSAVTSLGIENYNDPFNDVGLHCSLAWSRGEYKKAIKHNRSCLLKERDILIKRGFREPDELKLYRGK